MVLTQRELNKATCGDPNCKNTHVVLVSCPRHPDAPTYLSYSKTNGMLHLVCSRCALSFADVQVSALPPETPMLTTEPVAYNT